ncbi:MAG: 23S rRNA (adenine(2503)-C(2))-methyltransferase RlmN [Phycisphaeraceae bacterium]|nr:23S rRNA (adenine(2503)-C(2))-methyltransferase RlmN [Phycisphaeraceae bacterium]
MTCTLPESPFPLLACTRDEFVLLARRHGLAADAATRIYRAFHRDGAPPPPDASFAGGVLPTPTGHHDEGPARKFLLRFADGLETESVLLPQTSRSGRTRTALCVSSQVGCAMGCAFCETARMGRLRSLAAWEIVAQVHAARFIHGAVIDNVVFMGMGEPLDALEAVVPAIRVLTDRSGPAVPARRITVSTVGPPGGIDRLSEALTQARVESINLAVSLSAVDDDQRRSIMPVARALTIRALLDEVDRWLAQRGGRILVAWVLIPGVNADPAQAPALARLLGGRPVTLNVIPCNPIPGSPWPAPDETTIDRFIEACRSEGLFVRRRITLGRSVMAACGQLGNRAIARPGLPARRRTPAPGAAPA